MTDGPVSLHFEQNGSCYVPWLTSAWVEEDEWYVSLTVGNRYCDPLAGVTLTFKGAWVQTVGNWFYRRKQ